MELVLVVIAAALWGATWWKKCVHLKSDNMAVVQVLRSRTSKDNIIMCLLRCLSFYAFFHLNFVTKHIPGAQSSTTDTISRDNIPLFLSLTPQCPRCSNPKAVTDLLVEQQPNCMGLRGMGKAISDLFIQRLPPPPPATTAVYKSGWRRYRLFCSQHSLTHLLVSEDQLCVFVAHLSRSVTAKTIRSYLSTV